MDNIDRVIICFPERMKIIFSKFLGEAKREYITEIRLRRDAPMSITYAGRNICSFGGSEIVFSEKELNDTLSKLCEESVHTYGETMNEGFITLSGGLRLGVCGHAVSEFEKTRGVRDITSVCVRIPHIITGIADDILHVITHGKTVYPTLFYSVPGAGKTTLIRDISASLSSGGWRLRVCVVDARSEIYIKEMFSHSLCDFLDGYPKGEGIEIATRTLSPEVIVCDEIGGIREAEAIIAAQSSGVPLIATAHSSDISSLLIRPNIKLLYDSGIFRFFIKISRSENGGKPLFDIYDSRRGKN